MFVIKCVKLFHVDCEHQKHIWHLHISYPIKKSFVHSNICDEQTWSMVGLSLSLRLTQTVAMSNRPHPTLPGQPAWGSAWDAISDCCAVSLNRSASRIVWTTARDNKFMCRNTHTMWKSLFLVSYCNMQQQTEFFGKKLLNWRRETQIHVSNL